MTDGIIQKVFKNHIDKYQHYLDCESIESLLEPLQHELIEEIKNNSHKAPRGNSRFLTQNELIGDNQE